MKANNFLLFLGVIVCMMLLPKYFASLIVLGDLRRTAKAALKVESRFLLVDEQILNPLHESKQFLGNEGRQ
ncbi:Hypothetical predicted protein [Olea europaea subsp. europaea]|uniref:Uncharacterized protein n=1 Tax=Olea europaea subsp. europaea TaxID=158383 RepID=A0A8S0U8S9_OLEEU|nr:Hypothetical predicted protein [Olea europaea subsp. europaea]